MPPGLRWLLILIAALNIVGFAGLLVSGMALRLLVWPKVALSRRPILAFALQWLVLFLQSAGWLALSLSRDPSIWPLLCVFAAAVCLSCFLIGWELFSLYAALRPILDALPVVPKRGSSSSWRSRWRRWPPTREKPPSPSLPSPTQEGM